MPPTALLLALLCALPAQAQLRSAPVRAPVLAPTLTAPQAPSLAAPLLSVPALAPLPSAVPAAAAGPLLAPALALPRAAVPRAEASLTAEAARAQAAVPQAAQAALAQTVRSIERGGQAPALDALFSGARARPANAAAVLGAGGARRAPLRLRPAPAPAAALAARLAPAFAQEARAVAGLVAGRALPEAELADIVGRTTLARVGWLKRLFNEFGVLGSYPDGVARDDGRIELTERPAKGLPDPEAHYRALFAHEYTHRLQFEGEVTKRWGIEVPPVAVELLRGLELVGLRGLRAGRIPFITEGTLAGFESGRAWAAGARADDTAFHFKGVLAGAAWALAERTGRPADAWEFVRRVSSEKRREAPAAVFAELLGR